jgi:hypothetical protein
MSQLAVLLSVDELQGGECGHESDINAVRLHHCIDCVIDSITD